MARKTIVCPKCKKRNFAVDSTIKTTAKTKGPGIIGGSYNAMRGIANIATLGVAGKVLPKATGKTVIKTKVSEQYVCRYCGHRWKA